MNSARLIAELAAEDLALAAEAPVVVVPLVEAPVEVVSRNEYTCYFS